MLPVWHHACQWYRIQHEHFTTWPTTSYLGQLDVNVRTSTSWIRSRSHRTYDRATIPMLAPPAGRKFKRRDCWHRLVTPIPHRTSMHLLGWSLTVVFGGGTRLRETNESTADVLAPPVGFALPSKAHQEVLLHARSLDARSATSEICVHRRSLTPPQVTYRISSCVFGALLY